MRLPRSVSLLSLLLVTAALAGCFHETTTGSALRVGTETPFPPFESYNETTQQFEGFDIDVATEIAKRMGREIEFQNMGFDALIPAVQNGQIDFAISAMSITDERKEKVAFSDPYYQANQSVLVLKDSSIQSEGDVNKAGIRIGVQQGTVGQSVAENMSNNPSVNPFQNYPEAVAALKAGQVDAVLMDRPAQVEQVQQDPDTLRIAFDIFTDDNYGMALKKDNLDLLNQINSALSAMKSDGKLAELKDKWGV